MPTKNYDHLFPKMSDNERSNKALNLYKDVSEKVVSLSASDKAKLTEEYEKWMRIGIHPYDATLTGPFTVRDFLNRMGATMNNLEPVYVMAMLDVLNRSNGLLTLVPGKNKAGLNTVQYSKDTIKEMDKLKDADGKYKLNKWDRFWGLFGYKTEHAIAVEANLAGLQVCKDLQQELTKKVMSNQLESVRDNLVRNNEKKYEAQKDQFIAADKISSAWNRVLFGGKNVPDYVLDNGKKVSALSLCMAALQGRFHNDLSTMTPEVFAEKLKDEKNEAVKAKVEKVCSEIEKMARDSGMKKLKALDHLLNKDTGYADLDNKLKKYLKRETKSKDNESKREIKVFKPNAAQEYFKLDGHQPEERNAMFGQACVMLKVRDDMAELFGENDEIYGTKDAQGNSKYPEEEKFKNHAQKELKAIGLHEALQAESYDTVLKATNINDYSKLDEALTAAGKILNPGAKEAARHTLNEDYNEIDREYLNNLIQEAKNHKNLDDDLNDFSNRFAH